MRSLVNKRKLRALGTAASAQPALSVVLIVVIGAAFILAPALARIWVIFGACAAATAVGARALLVKLVVLFIKWRARRTGRSLAYFRGEPMVEGSDGFWLAHLPGFLAMSLGYRLAQLYGWMGDHLSFDVRAIVSITVLAFFGALPSVVLWIGLAARLMYVDRRLFPRGAMRGVSISLIIIGLGGLLSRFWTDATRDSVTLSTAAVASATADLAFFAALIPTLILARIYIPYFLARDAVQVREESGAIAIDTLADLKNA